MSAVNLSDAIAQLEAAGLDIGGKFRTNTAKPVRCSWSGDPKRNSKGWFMLYETVLSDGNLYITGSFGYWIGAENHAQKVVINADFKPDKADQALMRKQLAEARKKAEAEQKRAQEKAAVRAVRHWKEFGIDGDSGYCRRKQIDTTGLRFSASGVAAVSIIDTSGKIHGLQLLYDRDDPRHDAMRAKIGGGDKMFWPSRLAIKGNFHRIGDPRPGDVVLVTEGYATGKSLHMATGLPVVVAFNANNILPVLQQLTGHFKRNRFLVCADDDWLCRCQACNHQVPVADESGAIVVCSNCGEPHGKRNTGITVAINACAGLPGVQWIAPRFTDRTDPKSGRPRKLTDFNDLHVEESLQAVQSQITAGIADKFPHAGSAGAAAPARDAHSGGAGKAAIRHMSVDEACLRYSLIYAVKDTMFDHDLCKLVPKSCVMDITPDHAWREMKRRDDFRIFDIDEVGFDPSEADPNIRCNMWSGWPTVPTGKSGDRPEKLLELLAHMCSGEQKPRDVQHWITCWLAYPIQHPGAKMKTALVVHGGQGVGKNMFFETVMHIFGSYGSVIGQSELEEKFNDWASRKLFLIANEVVARQELFHQKNKIKALITDDWIHINPKNVAAYKERNHMNLVFLSNEAQPVVLDPDDRRFMAIWTPPKLAPEFYREVLAEIADGGAARLHQYLLEYDLGEFNPGTPPLQTRARQQLIEISKESPDRFIEAWLRGEFDVQPAACALADLYSFYTDWCRSEGERYAYAKNKFSAHIGRREDIDVPRKPVLQTNGKPKVTSVVLPECDNDPNGETWQTWLGDRVAAFSKAMGG